MIKAYEMKGVPFDGSLVNFLLALNFVYIRNDFAHTFCACLLWNPETCMFFRQIKKEGHEY